MSLSLRAWQFVSVLVILAFAVARASAETETRDFSVSVDDKEAGKYHMTIAEEKDGVVKMTGQAEIKVKVAGITAYKYSYGGSELWKDGRLVSFASRCNDDGKKLEVSAVSDGKELRIKANDKDNTASAETWTTSYWRLPDAKLRKGELSIMDADTGRTMTAKLKFIGNEKRTVGGSEQTCAHYRVSGGAKADLWYDASERLVHEEWLEDGHKTVLDLVRCAK
jgi:hypothetical protein